MTPLLAHLHDLNLHYTINTDVPGRPRHAPREVSE